MIIGALFPQFPSAGPGGVESPPRAAEQRSQLSFAGLLLERGGTGEPVQSGGDFGFPAKQGRGEPAGNRPDNSDDDIGDEFGSSNLYELDDSRRSELRILDGGARQASPYRGLLNHPRNQAEATINLDDPAIPSSIGKVFPFAIEALPVTRPLVSMQAAANAIPVPGVAGNTSERPLSSLTTGGTETIAAKPRVPVSDPPNTSGTIGQDRWPSSLDHVPPATPAPAPEQAGQIAPNPRGGREFAAPAAIPFISGSVFGHAFAAARRADDNVMMMTQILAEPAGSFAPGRAVRVEEAPAFVGQATAIVDPTPVSANRTTGDKSHYRKAHYSRHVTLPQAAVAQRAVPAREDIGGDVSKFGGDALTFGGGYEIAAMPEHSISVFSASQSLSLPPGASSSQLAPARAILPGPAAQPRGDRSAAPFANIVRRQASAASEAALPLNVTVFLGGDGVQVTARIKGAGEAEFERMMTRMLALADLSASNLVLNGRRIGPATRKAERCS